MYHKIESFCKDKGISVSQMCNDLGISPSVISNLKNRQGQTGLNAENTAKIAEYMGTTVLELIKKEGE